jgi:hypothetical protein
MLKERHARLAGDGAAEQRLAGAGRADQQTALGDAAAEALELLRRAQELDDLLQFDLGLVAARHVLEGDLGLVHVEELGAALAEAEGLVAAALHLAQEEDPQAEDEQERQVIGQEGGQPVHARQFALEAHAGIGRGDPGVEILAVDQNHLEFLHRPDAAVADRQRHLLAQAAGGLGLRDGELLEVTGVDLLGEGRVVDLEDLLPLVDHHLEGEQQQQRQDQPEAGGLAVEAGTTARGAERRTVAVVRALLGGLAWHRVLSGAARGCHRRSSPVSASRLCSKMVTARRVVGNTRVRSA